MPATMIANATASARGSIEREQAGHGDDCHSLRLAHGAAEILGESASATEDSDVGGEDGQEAGEPAEFVGKRRPRERVPGGDEDEGIGDAIGEVVEDFARRGAEATFDGDHAIEEVAEEAELDEGGGGEIKAAEEAERSEGSEGDAGERDVIGADAGAG